MDFSLDLGKVDPPIWRVMIGGQVYGPYTLGQLQGFAEEARIRPQTKIAQGDGAQFVHAEDIKELVPSLHKAIKSESVTPDQAGHNYIICLNLKSCGTDTVVRSMNTMGFFAQIMVGTYLLRSDLPLKVIHQRFGALMQTNDQVFIADASQNRFVSIHLPMESEVHVRELWDKKSGQAA